MTPSEWKAELKAPHGGYLFYGEEEYLKKSYLTALRKAVGVSGDPFNHLLFDGDNYSASALSDAIVTLPVLSDKKLVEVKGLPASFFKGKEGEGLFAALAQLSSCDFCVLVLLPSSEDFDAGTARRPSALFKKLTELLKPVEFARQTPARLASWVGRHFSAEQVISTPSAVEALLSVCGCDMGILASEIDKLCAYLKRNGRDRLTTFSLSPRRIGRSPPSTSPTRFSPVTPTAPFSFSTKKRSRRSALSFSSAGLRGWSATFSP